MKKAKYGQTFPVVMLFVIVSVLTVFQSVYAEDNVQTSATGPWVLEARFISFNSICNITKPELFPKNIDLLKDSTVTLTACGNVEKESSSKPLAVIIKISNTSKITQTLIFPLLSGFVIRTQEGAESAIAYCYSWLKMRGMREPTALWATDDKGTFSTDVGSGEQVELLYLVSRFSGKATIQINNIGSLKIDAPRDTDQKK